MLLQKFCNVHLTMGDLGFKTWTMTVWIQAWTLEDFRVNGWSTNCQIQNETGRSKNESEKIQSPRGQKLENPKRQQRNKARRDIVDTNPHAHAAAIAWWLCQAGYCTIRRSRHSGGSMMIVQSVLLAYLNVGLRCIGRDLVPSMGYPVPDGCWHFGGSMGMIWGNSYDKLE